MIANQSTPLAAPAVIEDVLNGDQVLRTLFQDRRLHSCRSKGTLIRSEQQDAPVFLVRRGFACRSCILPDGRRSIIDVLIPGDMGGLDSIVFPPSGEFVASDRLSYQTIEVETIRKMMDDRHVAFALFARIIEAKRRIERLATMVARFDAKQRLAALIVGIYDRLGRRGLINSPCFNLNLTQAQIADHLGLTLVHVNRTIRVLREERLVHVDRQVFMILDLGGLRYLANGLPEATLIPRSAPSAPAIEGYGHSGRISVLQAE